MIFGKYQRTVKNYFEKTQAKKVLEYLRNFLMKILTELVFTLSISGFAEENSTFTKCSMGIYAFLYVPIGLMVLINFVGFLFAANFMRKEMEIRKELRRFALKLNR